MDTTTSQAGSGQVSSAGELRREAQRLELLGEAEYAAGDMVAAHDTWGKAQALLARAAELERQ